MKRFVDLRSAAMSSAIWLAIVQVFPASVSTCFAVASGGTAITIASADPGSGAGRTWAAAAPERKSRAASEVHRAPDSNIRNCIVSLGGDRHESFDPLARLAQRALVGGEEGGGHHCVGKYFRPSHDSLMNRDRNRPSCFDRADHHEIVSEIGRLAVLDRDFGDRIGVSAPS